MPDYFGMDTRRLFNPTTSGSAAAQSTVVSPPFMSGVAYDMFGPMLPDEDIQRARTMAMFNRDLAEADAVAAARLANPRNLGAGINLDSQEAVQREVIDPFRERWNPSAKTETPHYYDTPLGLIRTDSKGVNNVAPYPDKPRMRSAAEMESENRKDPVLIAENQKAIAKLNEGVDVGQILADHPLLTQADPYRKDWASRLKDFRGTQKSNSTGSKINELAKMSNIMANAEKFNLPVSPFLKTYFNEVSDQLVPGNSPTVTTNGIKVRRYNPATRKIE